MSRISIRTKEKRFPVSRDLYGLFFEDISRAGDGGLYPEMLRNRSFEDSLLPEGCVTKDGGITFDLDSRSIITRSRHKVVSVNFETQ